MQEEKRAQEEGYSSSDAYSEEVSSSDAYSGSHEIDCSNILFVKAHSDFFIIFWCRKKAEPINFYYRLVSNFKVRFFTSSLYHCPRRHVNIRVNPPTCSTSYEDHLNRWS